MFGLGFKNRVGKTSSATQTVPEAGRSKSLQIELPQSTPEIEMMINTGLREGLASPIEVIPKGDYGSTGSHATLKRFVVKGADNRKRSQFFGGWLREWLNCSKTNCSKNRLGAVGRSSVQLLQRARCPTAPNTGKQGEKLHLVLKTAVKDPEARKRNFVTRKFRNEDAFYEHIRNRLLFENRSLSSESVTAGLVRNVKWLTAKNTRFPRIPKVYSSALTEGDEYILLEDLNEYLAHPDPQNLDAKHLRASVQALAAFHSASITWKASSPIEYLAVANLFCETEMMRPDDADPSVDFKTQKMNAALSAAAKACSIHLTGPYAISVEKVCHSANFEAPFWVSSERSEPWSVITHGDCWAKNFLYKYDKSKKITGVALVDFKSARAGSPVLDVTNFLLSSASPECLKDLRPFIEKHKDSMSPKITDYRSHIHQFGPYGVIASLVHHYYCVLYPNLDVGEATRLIENPELAEAYEMEMSKPDAKKIAGSGGKDNPNREVTGGAREKRAALVVKAAHDVRMI